jgi:uncharacterized membrane protein YbhN (UPF0104 family)
MARVTGNEAAQRGRWRRIVLRACAGLGLLALAVVWVGPQALAAHLAGVAPGWFAAALVVAIAANAVSAWRWSQLARALDLNAPYAPLASAYAQGIAVNALLPGATVGGDALRALRLARLGNPPMASALSVLADRASGLWVLCALSLAAVGLWLGSRGAPPAGITPQVFWLYVGGLLAAVSLPGWPWRRLGRALAAWRPAPVSSIAAWLAPLAGCRAALVRTLPLSLAVQLLSASALWLCAQAAGGGVGYGAVLAIAAPVFVAAALPLSVGGFGPREFAAAVAFPLVGAPAALGTAAAVLYGATAVVQGVLAAPLLAFGTRGAARR